MATPPAVPKEITITLPTDTYFMSGIRDFTLTMVRNMTGMNDQWAYRFQSVVDELCNNAIEHGSSPGESITIHFRSVIGEWIEIVVEDTGTGKKKTPAKEMQEKLDASKNAGNQPMQNLGLRGRGLSQIVSNWTSQLRFEDIEGKGLRVIARKDLTDEDRRPATNATLGFVSAQQ